MRATTRFESPAAQALHHLTVRVTPFHIDRASETIRFLVVASKRVTAHCLVIVRGAKPTEYALDNIHR